MGANQGEFSREIHERYGSRIFALEADPAVFERLNLPEHIVVENKALSETSGTVSFRRPPSGDSSLMLHGSSGDEFHITSTTLDELIEQHKLASVQLLKLDIEGAETGVILGAPDSALGKIEQITVEFHDFIDPALAEPVARCRERLKGLGFGEYSFSLNNGDVLYVNHRLRTLNIAERALLYPYMKYSRGIRRRLGRTAKTAFGV